MVRYGRISRYPDRSSVGSTSHGPLRLPERTSSTTRRQRHRTLVQITLCAAVYTKWLLRERCSATCQRRRPPGQVRHTQGGLQITAALRGNGLGEYGRVVPGNECSDAYRSSRAGSPHSVADLQHWAGLRAVNRCSEGPDVPPGGRDNPWPGTRPALSSGRWDGGARPPTRQGFGLPAGEGAHRQRCSRRAAGAVPQRGPPGSPARVPPARVPEPVHCHVRADDDRVWARLLELAADPDPRVRGDVIHALTDSTPAARVPAVIQALESRHNDPDAGIRRRRPARPSHTTAGPGR
jgi:hypothetical protein